MKRTFLTVEVEPDFKEFLDKRAKDNKVKLSRYVRAALVKATKYKERAIV